MSQLYPQVSFDSNESTLQQSRTSSVALDDGGTNRRPKTPTVIGSQEHHHEPFLREQTPDHEEAKPDHPHLYQPIWLTKRFFAALTFLFTSLWVTLIILWRIVEINDGLSLTLTSNHYAWTYGPTAILVVILSIWRQVDYHCKLIQPWREMISTDSTPQRSLLLDYISPMQIVSLYKSLRQRHYPVVLSVAGFIVLKLVILVSTTLCVPQQTLHVETKSIQYTSSFNASTLWSQITDRNTTGTNPYSSANVTLDFPWRYLNQLNGQAPDPNRVINNMTFQSFTLSASKDNITSSTAAVDVFISYVTCEAAEVGLPNNSMDGINPTFDSNTCSIGQDENLSIEDLSGWERLLIGDLRQCSKRTDDLRFVIGAFDFNINALGSLSVTRTTAVMCKMDFRISKANLTQSPFSGLVNWTDPDKDAGTPVDLNSAELSRMIWTGLRDNEELQTQDYLDSHLWLGVIPPTPIFDLMPKPSGYNSPEEMDGNFFNQDELGRAATSLFQGLALQFVTSQLLQPANVGGIGSVTASQKKLYIKAVPLIIIIVCFAVMTCFTIAGMIFLQMKVIPQNQGSIASCATVLTRSPSLAESLDGTGNLRTSALRKKLHGLQFKALTSDQKCSIEVTNLTQESYQSPSSSNTKNSDWIPFAARTPMLTLSFFSPLIVIAGLEVLQSISNANNGVIGLTNDDSKFVYYIRYSSTLVILLVATLFNNLDFTITTYTPFGALRSATTSSKRSLLVNLIGETPPVALYQCFQYRYVGTTLSMIAALLSSVLTIIVSGLWEIDNKVMMSTHIFAETDSWNLTWPFNSKNDNGAARLLNAIDFGGASEPTSIWNDLVLAKISPWSFATLFSVLGEPNNIPDFEFSRWSLQPELVFELSAHSLRPELVCKVASQENIRYNSSNVTGYTHGSYYNSVHEIQASFQLPKACWIGSPRNSSTVMLNYTSRNDRSSNHSIDLIGEVYDIDVGPAEDNSPLFDATSQKLLNSTGCPSLGFIFGQYENATALLCSQKIQKMPLQISYRGFMWDSVIDPQKPPSVSNSTTPEYATDPATGFPTYQYRIKDHLYNDMRPFKNQQANQHHEPEEAHAPTDQEKGWSNVFDHLLYGPFGVQRENILGPDKADNLIAAINKIYNKYMTLVIDKNFRVVPSSIDDFDDPGGGLGQTSSALGNSTKGTTINGTIKHRATRLKMNNASKLILQILLGIMTLFMAVAVKTVKIRRTLPRSPYSIASIMGFLAGSKMCDPKVNIIPPGSEFLSKKELARLFEGQKFSLGWWKLDAGQEIQADAENEEEEIAASEGDATHEGYELMPTGREKLMSRTDRFGIDIGYADGACRSRKYFQPAKRAEDRSHVGSVSVSSTNDSFTRLVV